MPKNYAKKRERLENEFKEETARQNAESRVSVKTI